MKDKDREDYLRKHNLAKIDNELFKSMRRGNNSVNKMTRQGNKQMENDRDDR